MRKFLLAVIAKDRECSLQDTLKELKNTYQNEVFDNGCYAIEFEVLAIDEIMLSEDEF